MTTEVKESKENEILVPRTGYVQGKAFYNRDMSLALEQTQKEGYRAIFMPELADTRIQADKGARIFNQWYTTLSIRVTGKTSKGAKVVVYSHADNHFSSPENIREEQRNLAGYAGIMPQPEFQNLVDSDGLTDESGNRLVWVIDYDTLRKSSSGRINVNKALKHPQTIPFLGGEERAVKYLAKHKEIYGEEIGIWHSDDLHQDGKQLLGRFLYLGDIDVNGLFGGNNLNSSARFVGVRDGAQKISRHSLEQLLKVSEGFVPDVARKDYEARVSALFHK